MGKGLKRKNTLHGQITGRLEKKQFPRPERPVNPETRLDNQLTDKTGRHGLVFVTKDKEQTIVSLSPFFWSSGEHLHVFLDMVGQFLGCRKLRRTDVAHVRKRRGPELDVPSV